MANELDELRNAYNLSPDNVFLQKMYFNQLKIAGSWAEAKPVLQRLLKAEPHEDGWKAEMGRLLYEMRSLSEGILFLEDVIGKGGRRPEYYCFLAKLYAREHSVDNANFYFNKLKREFPEYEDSELDDLFRQPVRQTTGYGSRGEMEEDGAYEAQSVRSRKFEKMEKPDVSFKDVGGMEQLKEEISMKIINPIKNADLFKEYGQTIGGGLLLYGPPGCGKTFIAKATAGEIDAAFFSVGLTDVLDMYVGQSEHNLKDIFEEARANTPAVLFFDELDALGGNRTDRKNSASRELINAFLQELDGVSGSNDGILFLGATNTPWYIDTAFKRPGRFGQAIFVAPPDVVAREEILSIHLKGKPVEEHLDLRKVAEKTEYFTGADLKSLVDLTIQDKLKEIMKTGRREPVTTKDLLKKCAEIHPSSNEWFETAKNYAIYSNQHGQYDEILKYLKIKK